MYVPEPKPIALKESTARRAATYADTTLALYSAWKAAISFVAGTVLSKAVAPAEAAVY